MLPELDGQEFRVRELASDSTGNELASKPRIAVLRSIMLNHWYHHPGQLSVLSSPARRAGPSDIWP